MPHTKHYDAADAMATTTNRTASIRQNTASYVWIAWHTGTYTQIHTHTHNIWTDVYAYRIIPYSQRVRIAHAFRCIHRLWTSQHQANVSHWRDDHSRCFCQTRAMFGLNGFFSPFYAIRWNANVFERELLHRTVALSGAFVCALINPQKPHSAQTHTHGREQLTSVAPVLAYAQCIAHICHM